jgi:hypothetical protein
VRHTVSFHLEMTDMKQVSRKLDLAQIEILSYFLILMGGWVAMLNRSEIVPLHIYVVPFIATILVSVAMVWRFNQIRKAVKEATTPAQVITQMLCTIDKNPGENREYESFVFTHLVTYLRKHANECRDNKLFTGVSYQVMYRLMDYVKELAKTEDLAFRSQSEQPDAKMYKKILADMEELEQLWSVLQSIAGADLRLEREGPKETKWPRASLGQTTNP